MCKKMIRNHEDFMENMKVVQPDLKIIGQYKAAKIPLIVETKYGQCNVRPDNLNQGKKPHIMSAVNPTEYWINMAREVHGNRYDYSLVKYINNYTDILIKCELHGVFPQLPANHTHVSKPQGCPDCGEISCHNSQRSNVEEFIIKANLKHNNEFTYENAVYINANSPILITCSKHGDFPMEVSNHLNGQKCPYCKPKRLSLSKLSNTDEFVKKALKIHKGVYDYSLVNYIDARTIVQIKCNKHGIFHQAPTNHLSKRGCPICAKELNGWTDSLWKAQAIKAGREDFCKVYIIKCTVTKTGETFYKIGKTFRELKSRFSGKTYPFTYEIVKEKYGEAIYISRLERTYHKTFKKYKYKPELKFQGSSECFKW